MTVPASGRRVPVIWLAAATAWRAGRFVWLGTIALAVLTGAMSPASAWVLKELIDHLTRQPASAGPVVMLTVAAVLLSGLGQALGNLSYVISAACQRTISVAVTSDLYAAVNRIQGLRHFERPGFQDDLRLAEQAADEVPAGLTSMFGLMVQGGTTIAGYAGILVVTWPPMMGLMAAACLPTATAHLLLSRKSAQVTEAMMGQYREWFLIRGLLSDPRAVMEARLLGLGEFFRSRLVRALRTATTGEYAMKRRIAWTQGGLSLLGGTITAAGAALVAVGAARGSLPVGSFVMFLAAAAGIQGVLFSTMFRAI